MLWYVVGDMVRDAIGMLWVCGLALLVVVLIAEKLVRVGLGL